MTDTYARLGLRCVDRSEYAAWARPLVRLGTHVTLGRFCDDARNADGTLSAWCAQMAEAGRCAAKDRPEYHRPLQERFQKEPLPTLPLAEYPLTPRDMTNHWGASLILCPRCSEWSMRFSRGLCRRCYHAVQGAERREKARLAG